MGTYNKVMQMFWLVVGVVTIIAVTFLGFRDGFERWSSYYIFGFFAILLYFVRRYMMKRMEKHQQFLNEKNKGKR
ncbi:hypothetical protein ERX46_13860 [Brumimicrobium glaciale]|uniref:Uncharacterized protein n=1 Tax=Brumimicrobium glaciale TaxID=200475 RepID=A0A4Q4KGN0_9FLAO|nr:hypothetical protein [Brumimicrobium glaciale]RYM32363.1 hypothetical protein ERX46_13860 [Brumimicrobium glaciale]